MGEQRVERKLAAILAADVAGYSRLMGANEVGPLRALAEHRREVLEPEIAAHHGRIVKTTGDGVQPLLVLPSTADVCRPTHSSLDGQIRTFLEAAVVANRIVAAHLLPRNQSVTLTRHICWLGVNLPTSWSGFPR
jgi:class 3 adenylate cyclase